MTKYIIVAVLLASGSAYAQEDKDSKQHMEVRKQELLQNFDSRIAHLQEAKSCVSAANTHEGIQSCRQKLETEQQELHKDMKQKRAAHLDEKIKKLEDQKAKMGQDQKPANTH